ncbi:MFS transporter [Kocuria sp. KSNUG]|uniref:MFS transporter n=1 Tax=Kocuria sp. KSNUG TaxID=3136676 RepID=UPI003C2F538F
MARSAETTASDTASAARTATLVVFGANGFAFASWMSRLPDIRAHFLLSPGELSMLLLAIATGSLIGLPLAGRVLERTGTTRGTRIAAAVAATGLVGASVMIATAPDVRWVLPLLTVFGLGNGMWDVAQNLEGATVEERVGRSIMPWFHAAFSGGTVLGALTGAAAIAAGVPAGAHIGVVVVLAAAAAWFASARFLTAPTTTPRRESHASRTSGAGGAWLEPRTLAIGVMVMAAAFTEGTANDWLAVAFVDGHGVSSGTGVIAVSVFLSAMTLARILGTSALDRFGRVTILLVLFGTAFAGSLMVVFGSLPVAFAGAAVWGIGASLGFPVGMSAASDDPARAAARLSVVSTMGYTAFLSGPPLLGLLGDRVGTLHALLAVGVAAVIAMVSVPAARPRPAVAPESAPRDERSACTVAG